MQTKYFYGYNIVAAGALIQAMCIGAMFTYGVFFKEFEAGFGWSRAMVSGASSLAFLIMGAGGVVAGSLNDRIGPRLILTVSGISMGVGYMLMSQLNTPWLLYLLYGFLVGIGLSTHDVITLSTVARWFIKRRGMMSGIVKVGTGFGQLVVPLIATALIAAFGWRSSYLIIGAVVLISQVAVAQFMRRDPEGIGLRPDGDSNGQCGTVAGESVCSLSLKEASRTGQFWMLFIFAVLYGFSHGAFFTVMSPTVAELFGIGSHGMLFGMILFSGTIGGSVGPLLTGYLFDVTGSYRIAFLLLTALAVMGFFLIALLRPPRAADFVADL